MWHRKGMLDRANEQPSKIVVAYILAVLVDMDS